MRRYLQEQRKDKKVSFRNNNVDLTINSFYFRFFLDSLGFLFIQYLTAPSGLMPNIADFEFMSRTTNGEYPAM